jgi:hypothetical protein
VQPNCYPPSNNTLNPIKYLDQDFATDGRLLLRRPPAFFPIHMPSPLAYDESSPYDAQESLTIDDVSREPGLLNNAFIENQNHGQSLAVSVGSYFMNILERGLIFGTQYSSPNQDLTSDVSYLTPSLSVRSDIHY